MRTREERDAETREMAIRCATEIARERPERCVCRLYGADVDATWPSEALIGAIGALQARLHAAEGGAECRREAYAPRRAWWGWWWRK